MKNKRIDLVMVEQGLVPSRTKAKDLIQQGVVFIRHHGQDKKVPSASFPFAGGEIFILQNPLGKYVSRAGLKLEGALNHLKLSVQGGRILDIGISTGGFADCLLQSKALQVVGIDVGHDQLAEKLRHHSQLQLLEGVNARYMDQNSDFLKLWAQRDFDLCVVDVSFISLTHILPIAIQYSKQVLALVKPQFEVGPEGLGKGGIVKDTLQYPLIQEKICKLLLTLGWQVKDYFSSEIEGKDGNKEFFVYACRD